LIRTVDVFGVQLPSRSANDHIYTVYLLFEHVCYDKGLNVLCMRYNYDHTVNVYSTTRNVSVNVTLRIFKLAQFTNSRYQFSLHIECVIPLTMTHATLTITSLIYNTSLIYTVQSFHS